MLPRVFSREYTCPTTMLYTESESLVQTLDDLATAPSSGSHTSALSLANPVAQLQTIEHPERLQCVLLSAISSHKVRLKI